MKSKSKIKTLKCKLDKTHKLTTFDIYHGRRIEVQKCDTCGERKEIPFIGKKL